MNQPADPPDADEPATGSDATPDAGAEPAGPADRADQVPPGAVRVRIRRAPRYRAFVATGVLIGVVVGLLLVLLRPRDPRVADFSVSTLAGYLALLFGMAGGLLGATVAVIADRRG